MNILWILALCLAAKDIPLAVVVRVKGTVLAGPTNHLKPIKSGDVVSRNWHIKTESDGRVLLRFLFDRALVDIKPSSRIELDVRPGQSAGSAQDITIHGGQAAFSIPASDSGDRSRTATTVMTSKQGQFGIATEVNGNTRVDVLKGTVQVCNQLTGEHSAVGSGQSQISGYDGLESLRPMSTDSSLAQMDLPATPVKPTSSSTQLQVPFIDPVSGKTSLLTIGIKRAP